MNYRQMKTMLDKMADDNHENFIKAIIALKKE